ncbi:hypothetical protein [uncultured Thiocystis sp.]|jgi:hypothetical protein|uniref:hypothetical protein n=1 Tax=uncultured Thiocystis sp. TaxID=1202134 RepID=UPI0025EE8048|nr:hypothetical protein [uncultured Thiocystis sp.]
MGDLRIPLFAAALAFGSAGVPAATVTYGFSVTITSEDSLDGKIYTGDFAFDDDAPLYPDEPASTFALSEFNFDFIESSESSVFRTYRLEDDPLATVSFESGIFLGLVYYLENAVFSFALGGDASDPAPSFTYELNGNTGTGSVSQVPLPLAWLNFAFGAALLTMVGWRQAGRRTVSG